MSNVWHIQQLYGRSVNSALYSRILVVLHNVLLPKFILGEIKVRGA